MDFEDITEFLGAVAWVLFLGIIGLLGLGAFITLLLLIGTYTGYKLDQSYCTAKVNNEVIYSGRCHYLELKSVGENGNTKHLTIYKDKMLLQPVKNYVNDNITIEEYNKGGING